MKILELLEDIEPVRSEKIVNRNLDRRSKVNYDDPSQYGYFSVVHADRKDPHMIKKYNGRSDKHDPFHDYIDTIIDTKSTNNPWFPRVYAIKDYIGTGERKIRSFTIEKLIPYKEISIKEFEAIFRRTFRNAEEMIEDIINGNGHVDRFQSTLRDSIILTCKDKKYGYIIDDNLKQACELISELVDNLGYSYDLHNDNLMFRRTSLGVQPVINDPIA